MDIKNKVAIVTGGASGLGKACVDLLIQKGACAAILDMDEKNGKEVESQYGDKVLFFKTDISNEENVKDAIDAIMDKFNGINFVINCAGIGTAMKVLGKDGPMSMDFFNKTISINLTGTMNVICHATPKIIESESNSDGEKGVVINTASVAAFEGQIGQVAYTASKAAIVGITLPMAREFADYGIRVATIAPGIFETPMLSKLPEKVKASLAMQVPFPKRLGKPEEFAQLVCSIIENPLINGETIRLDGSIRMSGR
ncbi:MAG: SDR family NAD(P)-dependent oxidoreductase [Desulfobacterales bacterium]|nr:SDR family NAD(P)-dependent oxidoreductase [Desulfobacterales bacterium]MCP4159580.1 SDR family NAD(P)-dependent oxidoreductase [Deltaproteobacteria bacterium]